MIRGLVLVLGLGLGLSLAAITQTRLSHLRQMSFVNLPAWTGTLSPDSGVMRGKATGLNIAFGADVTLAWQFVGIGVAGPRYRLVLNGKGVDAQADLFLPWRGNAAMITGGGGELDLTHMPDIANSVGLVALVRVDTLVGTIDLTRRQIKRLASRATVRQISLGGVPLSDVTVTLDDAEPGAWLARLDMPTGPLQLAVNLRGAFVTPLALVDAQVTAGAKLPDGWRQFLDDNLAKTPTGWRIEKSVDLRHPVFDR